MSNAPSKVTIKDIAQRANVSLGTASKVLNGDSSVKESNRRAVEEAVRELNYNVNKVARSLAHKPLRFGILLPSEFKEYYRPMLNGIRSAVAALSDFKVSATFERYANYNDDEKVIAYLDKFEEEGIDGLILGPSRVCEYSGRIAKLQKKRIPVIVLMSDMVNSGRLACVDVDAKLSGKIAVDLSKLILEKDESVAIFIGNKDMVEHRIKMESFLDQAKKQGVRIAGVREAHENPVEAYELTAELLEKCTDLRLIYVATANSESVCRCIHAHGRQGKVHVIATDILADLRPYVEDGTVVAVLDQHLWQQGDVAVDVLYKYLTEAVLNKEETKVAPSLLLKSSILAQLNMPE
ncbi:MAG: LacI family transcriptional regulator [Lachnospiraceae bacterium]|nr:LacI family transcriptional regulator [Lachnospiraceae bacterium]